MAIQQETNGLRELALFAGAGGGILGGKLLGWRTVCAVEWDAYAASVLVARQNDGCLPPFPIWDDVQTFDGRPWRGRVDVISGGFPCQDISAAGKGAGIDGERSGMWGHMARIVGEVLPQYVFVENSPLLVGRGLTRVLGDLAKMGYDARWGIVGARHAAAPHKRDRIWIVANSKELLRNGCTNHSGIITQSKKISKPRNCCGEKDVAHAKSGRGGRIRDCQDSQGTQSSNPAQPVGSGSIQTKIPDSISTGLEGYAQYEQDRNQSRRQHERQDRSTAKSDLCSGGKQWWATEPKLGRVAHGVAHRVDRLKCIGNGQVPHVAALAWRLLGGLIK